MLIKKICLIRGLICITNINKLLLVQTKRIQTRGVDSSNIFVKFFQIMTTFFLAPVPPDLYIVAYKLQSKRLSLFLSEIPSYSLSQISDIV